MASMNQENMDDVGLIGGEEEGRKLLSEMNSLAEDYDDFLKSVTPRVDAH